MIERTLSGCFGKGDINHNNRSVITENVDKSRIKNDIIICQRSLKQLYHDLFDEALQEYNDKQKRRDRKIPNYQEHIRHSRQEKEFYEVLFQVGNRDDTGIDSDACKNAAEVLVEYARTFQDRNPHLRLFNAVVHMDESTPHLHLDFVPVTDEPQKRGLRVRNSLTGALRQQGMESTGIGHTITMDWLEKEKEHIGQLMREHGIEWVKLGAHEEHLSVKDFKLKKRQEEIKKAETKLSEKREQLDTTKMLIDKIDDELDTKLTELSDVKEKVDSSQEELSQIQKKANDILKYIPDFDKNTELEKKFDEIRFQLDDSLKNPLTIMRYKDSINSNINSLQNITKKALNMQWKSENTVYELHEHCDRIIKERDEAIQEKKKYQSRCSRLEKENSEIEEKFSILSAIMEILECLVPDIVAKAKAIFHSRKNRELEQQSNHRKKKSYDLE